MKTTRYDAEKLYKIGKWIDPYESCHLDKKEQIDSLMSFTLEENIKMLKEYICEGYPNPLELLDDTKLLTQYLNIVRKVRKNATINN